MHAYRLYLICRKILTIDKVTRKKIPTTLYEPFCKKKSRKKNLGSRLWKMEEQDTQITWKYKILYSLKIYTRYENKTH